MGVVTAVALASALTQPVVGRLRDAGRVDAGRGTAVGLLAVTVGTVLAAASCTRWPSTRAGC